MNQQNSTRRKVPSAVHLGLLACLLLSASFPIISIATPPETPSSPRRHLLMINDLISDLRSNKFSAREDATAMLLRLPPDRLSEIEVALAKETDEEASNRLLRIAIHLFLKGQTSLEGATSLLGIQFTIEPVHLSNADDFHMAITITDLRPGFPAAEVLRTGDRLVAIDDTPFPIETSSDDFRNRIITNHPGTVINFTVMRAGKLIHIPVQLAGLQETNQSLENFVLQRDQAAERYRATLKVGLTSEPLVMRDGLPEGAQQNPGGSIQFVIPPQ